MQYIVTAALVAYAEKSFGVSRLWTASRSWTAFSKQIAKMHYFRKFLKKVINPVLNFRAFRRKAQWLGQVWENIEIFDEISIEKFNFYLYWEKLFLKIEPSKITFFYENVCGSGAIEPPNAHVDDTEQHNRINSISLCVAGFFYYWLIRIIMHT